MRNPNDDDYQELDGTGKAVLAILLIAAAVVGVLAGIVFVAVIGWWLT